MKQTKPLRGLNAECFPCIHVTCCLNPVEFQPVVGFWIVSFAFPPLQFFGMATLTVPARASGGRRLGRVFLRSFLVLSILVVLLVAGTFAWFYHIAHISLPQLDGALKVPGLQASVDVVRDGHGVPHITASSLDDLFLPRVTSPPRIGFGRWI